MTKLINRVKLTLTKGDRVRKRGSENLGTFDSYSTLNAGWLCVIWDLGFSRDRPMWISIDELELVR